MDNKAKLLRRLAALVFVLFLLGGIAVAGLYALQIINGEEYRVMSERRLSSTATIEAARGEILDRYGRPLVTNRTVYNLVLEKTYWHSESGKQNSNLLELNRLIANAGCRIEQSLPITAEAPYEFIGEADSEDRKALDQFLADHEKKMPTLGENDHPDAADIIEALRLYYGVSDSYSKMNARIIVGLRYELDHRSFSRWNPFTLCENAPMDLIAQVKERSTQFAGVNVEASTVRSYETSYAAHILGEVGPIYAEEWADYRDQGYAMNATVGKSGLEKSLEKYLHGKQGSRTVETTVAGTVTRSAESDLPVPGNNCITTIDLSLQQTAEDSLNRRLHELEGTEGGAAVVIDVNSGEVLALASYPTYNIETFHEDYNELLADPLSPMYNRAIAGLYPPGSTFKPLTATAALEEGAITENFTETCQHYYTRFTTRTYTCMGYHGTLNVVSALQKSCNVFFYETGYRLGEGNNGATLEDWQHKFGLGQKTGIELSGEKAGSASGPAHREAMRKNDPWLSTWQAGDIITTAIGQSDLACTPLQLANYLATLVNGGTRYQATLLRSVKSYDYGQTVYEHEPTAVEKLDISDKTIDLVMRGMGAVVSEGGTAARIFADYPIRIGGKSGTAQTGRKNKKDNGVFIAFAPYDNPEIAVCVVGECAGSGSNVAPIVRDILDGYFTDVHSSSVQTAHENTLQP